MSSVEGAVNAMKEHPNLKLALVGKSDIIKQEFKRLNYNSSSIEIIHADEVITNDDSPTGAIKKKKNSSMVVGLNLVKEGKAGAFISAGNTGALLTGSILIVGRIKGVERPALATMLPNSSGFTLLLDSGANVDCKPSYLCQFAKMGSVYMEIFNNGAKPKVGLVNIGSEEEKGSAMVKEAFELLKQQEDINFVGNVEAREIPLGAVDVAVCDGFVGNVILKYTEGFAKGIMGIIKEEMMSTTVSKLGALLAKGAFKKLKKRFDYAEIGGAPFLGLNGLVVKAHGSSDAKAFKGAINQCVSFLRGGLITKMENSMSH